MKTILVPIDFSPAALNAAKYAALFAKEIQATICLCYVCPPSVTVLERGLVLASNNSIVREVFNKMHEVKAGLHELSGPGVKINCQLRVGSLTEQIREISAINKIDFVVVGINENRKAGQLFLKSNALNIMQNTNCPTIIVPSTAIYKGILSIAFAYDYNFPKRKRILDKIVDFARSLNAKLDVVYVNKGYTILPAENAEKGIALERKISDIRHDYFFVNNENVTEGIKSFVNEHHSDIVIMLPRSMSVIERVFKRSETKEVMLDINIPLLAIH